MDWGTGIQQALDEFTHHKLRTLLTLLGMIFGVGAVISMLWLVRPVSSSCHCSWPLVCG